MSKDGIIKGASYTIQDTAIEMNVVISLEKLFRWTSQNPLTFQQLLYNHLTHNTHFSQFNQLFINNIKSSVIIYFITSHMDTVM